MDQPDTRPRQPEVMSLKELASNLGISVGHAENLARADRLPLPTITVGRRRFFSRPLYEQLMRGEYQREIPKKETDDE